MKSMKLYYFETPNPRLACAVARHVDAPVEYVRVDLTKGEQRRPEYLAINPNGKVPALVDGDITLWEGPAIAYHLAAKSGSDLLPANEAKRADVMRWVNWSTAHFWRHSGRLLFERAIKPALQLGETNPVEVEDATGYFLQFAKVLNDHLRGREYLVGDRLSLADFVVGTPLPAAEAAGLPLDDFDEIRRWNRRLEMLPAWRDPFPKAEQRAVA